MYVQNKMKLSSHIEFLTNLAKMNTNLTELNEKKINSWYVNLKTIIFTSVQSNVTYNPKLLICTNDEISKEKEEEKEKNIKIKEEKMSADKCKSFVDKYERTQQSIIDKEINLCKVNKKKWDEPYLLCESNKREILEINNCTKYKIEYNQIDQTNKGKQIIKNNTNILNKNKYTSPKENKNKKLNPDINEFNKLNNINEFNKFDKLTADIKNCNAYIEELKKIKRKEPTKADREKIKERINKIQNEINIIGNKRKEIENKIKTYENKKIQSEIDD